MTKQHAALNFLAPIDPRTLLYVARADDRSGPWLWSLDVETKVSRRVINDLDHYTSVAASRDGRRVVATVAHPTASLWRVPLRDRIVEDGDAKPYPLPATRALAPRFGGTSLFYLSSRGTGDGRGGFATARRPKSEAYRLAVIEPVASPDDFASYRRRWDGKRRLTVVADGTGAQSRRLHRYRGTLHRDF
jgi:hypothetical protein